MLLLQNIKLMECIYGIVDFFVNAQQYLQFLTPPSTTRDLTTQMRFFFRIDIILRNGELGWCVRSIWSWSLIRKIQVLLGQDYLLYVDVKVFFYIVDRIFAKYWCIALPTIGTHTIEMTARTMKSIVDTFMLFVAFSIIVFMQAPSCRRPTNKLQEMCVWTRSACCEMRVCRCMWCMHNGIPYGIPKGVPGPSWCWIHFSYQV